MQWWQWLLFAVYYVSAVCIAIGYVWTIVLFISGYRYLRRWNPRPPGDESKYLWVFLVPALNEGVTIADSVARLRAVTATNKVVLVINDGSDDNTGEVLESIAGPDLSVLTRVPPEARVGKAAALNSAYAHIRSSVLNSPGYSHWHPDHVIVTIIDADGRLAADAPQWVSRHFDDPRVGGVQVNVHVYNQTSYLTRQQGMEFTVFGGLFQLGRSTWGTAFMGGNGQFNRLSALESVASTEGPWSHYLTEDQELGLRLLERGWRGEHSPYTQVDQQGLNKLRPLWRQRTRWFQGNLQVLGSIRRLNSPHLVGVRRLDASVTVVMPVLMMAVGFALIGTILAALILRVPYLPWTHPLLMAFFIQLSLGPVFLGVIVTARGHGLAGIWLVLRRAVPYLAYTWIMWPVVFMGLWRQLRGEGSWAKTARESVEPAGDGEEQSEPTPAR